MIFLNYIKVQSAAKNTYVNIHDLIALTSNLLYYYISCSSTVSRSLLETVSTIIEWIIHTFDSIHVGIQELCNFPGPKLSLYRISSKSYQNIYLKRFKKCMGKTRLPFYSKKVPIPYKIPISIFKFRVLKYNNIPTFA